MSRTSQPFASSSTSAPDFRHAWWLFHQQYVQLTSIPIGNLRHTTTLGVDLYGNIQRLDNVLENPRLQNTKDHLANTRQQLEEAKTAVDKPFPYEEDLSTKSARLAELNTMLDLNRQENEILC